MIISDICIENPNVSFNDIVGLDQAKRLLKEAVMLPLKYPQLFTGNIYSFLIKCDSKYRNIRTLERSLIIWTTRHRQGKF